MDKGKSCLYALLNPHVIRWDSIVCSIISSTTIPYADVVIILFFGFVWCKYTTLFLYMQIYLAIYTFSMDTRTLY